MLKEAFSVCEKKDGTISMKDLDIIMAALDYTLTDHEVKAVCAEINSKIG